MNSAFKLTVLARNIFAAALIKWLMFLFMTATAHAAPPAEAPRLGPLTIHPTNSLYFARPDGRAVWLTGSHTWATFQERGVEGQTPDFDYGRYLDFLQQHGHNFQRMWVWEHAQWMQFADADVHVRYKPTIFARTGPGLALDGQPKFDLTKFNDEFFERLRERVIEAGKRDIYVGVMFFQGFSVKKPPASPRSGNNWHGNPFNKANNINGLDGSKIMVVDTDHCRAMKYDPVWVWTNFTRGNHFILMDSYMDYRVGTPDQPDPKWNATRNAMGAARRLSEQLDLTMMTPLPELASSRFCLADPGKTWVVFHTGGESLSVRTGPGKWHTAWLDPSTGKEILQLDLDSSTASLTMQPPQPGNWVLLVTKPLHQP